jgi:hypothetical protein
MPYDAPTWDMTAVLYAGRPQENYFKLSGAGTISVLDDGRTKFTPSAEGRHRYLITGPGAERPRHQDVHRGRQREARAQKTAIPAQRTGAGRRKTLRISRKYASFLEVQPQREL